MALDRRCNVSHRDLILLVNLMLCAFLSVAIQILHFFGHQFPSNSWESSIQFVMPKVIEILGL